MNSVNIPDTNTAVVAARKIEDVELDSLRHTIEQDAENPKVSKWRLFRSKKTKDAPEEKARTPPVSYFELYK